MARHLPSPNFSVRPDDTAVSLVVLHNISLPPFEYGTGAVADLFLNRVESDAHPFFAQLTDLRVSAHFFIDRNGDITQFVSCNDVAYHAGVSAFRGQTGCNAFSIGIELAGCDFEPFEAVQYDALLKLVKDLLANYPIEAIIGHQHIAPSRKTDPGHFFDWAWLKTHGLPIADEVFAAM